MTGPGGLPMPGLARMAEVTRAISEAARRGPGEAVGRWLIYEPWSIVGQRNTVTAKNRIVMPAIPTGLASTQGDATDAMNEWYRARSVGGVGLILVEPAHVIRDAGARDSSPVRGEFSPRLVIDAKSDQKALRSLSDAIRSSGAVPGISLALPSDLDIAAAALSDFKMWITAVAVASSACEGAGFEVVELVFSHDGLVHRSLRRATNRRTDRFGRGEAGRFRLARELARSAVTAAMSPVIVKFAIDQRRWGGLNAEAGNRLALALQDDGVAALEIVGGDRWDDASLQLSCGVGEGPVIARTSGAIHQGVRIPIIASGRLLSPTGAEETLRDTNATAVAMGRALIADPSWVAKARAGVEEEIVPCIGCLGCHSAMDGGTIGCVVNGDEVHITGLHVQQTSHPLNIAVLGAGLPGLEFARVASSRGHDVTVIPGTMPLGGVTGLRSSVPGNAEFGRAFLYFGDRLREFGSGLGETIPDDCDLVVDARPLPGPKLSWAVGRSVLTASSVLGRDLHQMYGIGRRVAICGPGSLAGEVALFLAGWGRRPTVVVPGTSDNPFPDAHPMHALRLVERLAGYKCDLVTDATPVEWNETLDRKHRLTVRRGDGTTAVLGPFQTAVEATGWSEPQVTAPTETVVNGTRTIVLGDSQSFDTVRKLVHWANQLARTV